MTNPENLRLLGEERGALEAEMALAREEQKLWQRLDAVASDAASKRAQALAARLSAVEMAGMTSPDFARIRSIIASGAAADPVLAPAERGAEIAARRAAIQ